MKELNALAAYLRAHRCVDSDSLAKELKETNAALHAYKGAICQEALLSLLDKFLSQESFLI